MVWEDRDYNRSGGSGDFLSGPSAILSLSVPFGTWFGVRVRLNIWLLISIAFIVASLVHGVSPLQVGVEIAALLAAVLLHDFGHRIFAGWVGGRLDEFMLWPAGGMIFPSVPPGAWPLFVAHVGGMAVNLVLGLGCYFGALYLGSHFNLPFNPMWQFGGGVGNFNGAPLANMVFISFAAANWGVVLVNFLPYYWFDGGFLLQSLLHPFTREYGAINLTCLVGMILAVPMFALSLVSFNFMGMVFWTLLFYSALTRRRQLKAEGVNELQSAIAYSAQQNPASWRKRKWLQPDYAKRAAKKAAKEREEQAAIDEILAKVSASGMHTLSEREKRTLQKATEKQRKRSTGR